MAVIAIKVRKPGPVNMPHIDWDIHIRTDKFRMEGAEKEAFNKEWKEFLANTCNVSQEHITIEHKAP